MNTNYEQKLNLTLKVKFQNGGSTPIKDIDISKIIKTIEELNIVNVHKNYDNEITISTTAISLIDCIKD